MSHDQGLQINESLYGDRSPTSIIVRMVIFLIEVNGRCLFIGLESLYSSKYLVVEILASLVSHSFGRTIVVKGERHKVLLGLRQEAQGELRAFLEKFEKRRTYAKNIYF